VGSGSTKCRGSRCFGTVVKEPKGGGVKRWGRFWQGRVRAGDVLMFGGKDLQFNTGNEVEAFIERNPRQGRILGK